jgi:phosphoglycolate phosphatase-like HAD superfamily hydrolase
MKLLSDFDGVWTDPTPEAEAVRSLMIERTAALSGETPQQVEADLEALATIALGEPAEHGWAPHGRISAFADEDPLILGNATAEVMRRWGADAELAPASGQAVAGRCAVYCLAVRDGGYESMDAYADKIFHEGTARFREQHSSALLPGAREAAERMLAEGLEVVVVSNSSEDKILNWFELAGIEARSVSERKDDGARCLFVRGSAGKFVLGEGDEQLTIGKRRIFIDRPMYTEAIRAEAPDVICGDVFSLDLALPHALRQRGERWAPSHLVLAMNTYTPAWSGVERAGGAIDHVVNGLSEFCDLLARL